MGHAGTLDPDAAGVLVLGLGRATKLLPWVDGDRKQYWGRLEVGWATKTGDAAGSPVAWSRQPWPHRRDWMQAARVVSGHRLQIPSSVSAKKVAGRRAYQAVRSGQPVWLKPVPIYVESLAVLAVEGPWVEFEARVSRGTYVRALVRDWAAILGHAAHLSALIRTGVGGFLIQEAKTIEELPQNAAVMGWQQIWPYAKVELSETQARWVSHGHWPEGLSCPSICALTRQGRLLAVSTESGRFARVFPEGWA